MGPPNTDATHTDNRGTQTDLVTDRLIADCLLELKSTSEFQDLTYRLNRTCSGEMTLTVTRASAMGMLGGPFDPMSVTVMASGLCYFHVLFMPLEVISLKQDNDFNLRKFRQPLLKLNGRAGFGFCPGFKVEDFPARFDFASHHFEVLRHPLTRVQSPACRVFSQLRRSCSRAESQPLVLQVCSHCRLAMTKAYMALKDSKRDALKPLFSRLFQDSGQQPAAKDVTVDDDLASDSSSVTLEDVSMESIAVDARGPAACPLSSSTESLVMSAALPSEDYPMSLSMSLTPSTSSAIARNSAQTAGEGSQNRPVVSAFIKPFLAVEPHGKGVIVPGSTGQEAAEVLPSVLLPGRWPGRYEASPDPEPPVLTREGALSPDSPASVLMIDEDAVTEEAGPTADEPVSKRVCLRCSSCQETFPSSAELEQHRFHHHLLTTTATQPASLSAASSPSPLATEQLEEGGGAVRKRVCPICKSESSSKDELQQHLRDRHHARLHPCRYCGQSFALKKNLADHLQRHRGSKLTCNECGAKFSRKKDFASHVRQHMGSLPYFCTVCSKMFSREGVYKEHMDRHRARHGVKAVLTGSDKTRHEITAKARKCLEEKTLMNFPSSSTAGLPSSATSITPTAAAETLDTQDASAAESVSHTVPVMMSSAESVSHTSPAVVSTAVVSEPMTSPPSNLLLLSAVSLARAELDRQPISGPLKETSETLSTESSSAAAQLLEISQGKLFISPAVSSGSMMKNLNMQNNQELPVSTPSMSAGNVSPKLSTPLNPSSQPLGSALGHHTSSVVMQTQLPTHIMQRLDGDASASNTGTCGQSQVSAGVQKRVTGVEPQVNTGFQTQVNAGVSGRETGFEPQNTGEDPNLSKQGGEGPGGAREQQLRQKERELKVQELAILRQNVMLQQLLMAQLGQSSGATNGTAATGGQPKVDQARQQVLASMAALKTMAGRSLRQVAPLLLRPPHQVTHPPRPPGMGAQGFPRPQVSSAQSLAPHTMEPVVRKKAEAVAVSDSAATTPSLPSPSAPPKLPIPRVLPSPHGATALLKHKVAMADYKSGESSSLTNQPPANPKFEMLKFSKFASPFQHGGFFLQEIMKLESKMPSKAKEFLPSKSKAEKLTVPVAKGTNKVPVAMSSYSKKEETGHTIPLAGRGRKRSSKYDIPEVGANIELPNTAEALDFKQKKHNVWSGGQVKVKVNQVGTAVPPEEVKRLMELGQMTLATSKAPLVSELMSQPSFSTRVATPSTAAPDTSPATEAASNAQVKSAPVVVMSPAPLPSPVLCLASSRSGPAPKGLFTRPGLAPQRFHLGHAPTTLASNSEEHVPMDLTKSKSLAAKSDGQPVDKATNLRRVLMDSLQTQNSLQALAQQQSSSLPAAESSRAEGCSAGVAEACVQPPAGFVHPPRISPQAQAIRAQLQATLRLQDQRFLATHSAPRLPQQFPAPSQTTALADVPPPTALPSRVVYSGDDVPRPGVWQKLIALTKPPEGTGVGTSNLSSSFVVAPTTTSDSVFSLSKPLLSPVRSPGSLSTTSLASQGSAGSVPSPSRSTRSPQRSVSSSPAQWASPASSALPSPTPASGELAQFFVPSRTVSVPPESAEGTGAQNQKKTGHPLGGFAWHRPAVADPSDGCKKEGSPQAPRGEPSTADRGQEERLAPKSEAELDDQDLSQQKFLQTLLEKRRQRIGQHQRQQPGEQPQPQPQPSHPQPRQRRRRPKSNSSGGGDGDGMVGNPDSGSAVTQHFSPVGPSSKEAEEAPLLQHEAELSTVGKKNSASQKGSDKASPSRSSRGRHRKKSSPATPGEAPEKASTSGAEARAGRARPEGSDARHGHRLFEAVVKIEPLEEGVQCSDCNKVFYREIEILQHECEAWS